METYRKVQIANLADDAAELEPGDRDADGATPTAYPTTEAPRSTTALSRSRNRAAGWASPSSTRWTSSRCSRTTQSLDKVPIFNLLVTPGITDRLVTSEAVAYCERKRAFYIVDTPSPETTGWDVNSIVDDLDQVHGAVARARPSASTPRCTTPGCRRPTR